jgi:D-beta-D-heptose 7-phosphate kinase/D-beta-D-heptose 1-phosphate adenosyltransferase
MKPKEMLVGRLLKLEDLSDFHKAVKEKGKKVVFTAGNWDLIHIGQMRYLAEAKKKGDILVVGVQGNDPIQQVKGPGKPILDEMVRAETLCFLKSVDFVIINPTPSTKAIIELLKPNIFISVQEDWASGYKESKEYKAVLEYGGDFQIVERQSLAISTTQIIERIVGGKVIEAFGKFIDKSDGPVKERYSK